MNESTPSANGSSVSVGLPLPDTAITPTKPPRVPSLPISSVHWPRST